MCTTKALLGLSLELFTGEATQEFLPSSHTLDMAEKQTFNTTFWNQLISQKWEHFEGWQYWQPFM